MLVPSFKSKEQTIQRSVRKCSHSYITLKNKSQLLTRDVTNQPAACLSANRAGRFGLNGLGEMGDT